MKKIYLVSFFLGLNLGALGISISLSNSLIVNVVNGLDSILYRNYGIIGRALSIAHLITLVLLLTAAFFLITFFFWKFFGKLKTKYSFSNLVKISLLFGGGVLLSPMYLVLLVFLLGVLGFVWVG